MAFVSDTQSPMFPEAIRLSRNNNKLARAKIFDSIVQWQPHSVFHLGDLVALGFWSPSWEAIDAFTDRLRALGTGFHPVMGNHELMLFSKSGEANFQKRFPRATRTGYLRRAGPLAVVLLNSNFKVLTDDERAKQLSWYWETLGELDNDSTVGLVVVACHYSPYTNSKIVSPSAEVQESFVPPFLESAKARIFLSGHAHAAEHFRIHGKDFLVIGGGGGLQQPLLTGPDARWPDLFPQKTEKRMFHYVEGVISGASATFTVRMLNDDFSSFSDVLTVRFDFETALGGMNSRGRIQP
ncbi:MAG: metallophosphoesterase [Desulfobacterota bacterium]|nr:metallophosphoesterase [Thermodesulfobacteriota bacterium]